MEVTNDMGDERKFCIGDLVHYKDDSNAVPMPLREGDGVIIEIQV